MNSVAVFCGSSVGNDEKFIAAAEELGRYMGENEITLVYGGANRGLMGKIADAALEAGGKVIGVIPKFLVDVEVAHQNLTELIVTESMHERKLAMFERSDGFVAMPGGIGTLEELFEITTWVQLDLHKKPIGLLNVNGYYDLLFQQLDHMVCRGLLKPFIRDYLLAKPSVKALIQEMESHEPGNGSFLEKSKV